MLLVVQLRSAPRWKQEGLSRGSRDVRRVLPHLDRVYFIPVAAVPERQVVLRVEPARNGQAMNVRRAEEYEHWPAVIPR
jgi:hypothetical protein